MSMTPIQTMEQLKEFTGKKHMHFCKICWARFVCGIADRKDCSILDGIICADCKDSAGEKRKEN